MCHDLPYATYTKAHARGVTFRKQRTPGYPAANGRRVAPVQHMGVMVFKMLVSRARSR